MVVTGIVVVIGAVVVVPAAGAAFKGDEVAITDAASVAVGVVVVEGPAVTTTVVEVATGTAVGKAAVNAAVDVTDAGTEFDGWTDGTGVVVLMTSTVAGTVGVTGS